MNIYVYNSSTGINQYSTEDFGSITSSWNSSIDCNLGSNSLPIQTAPNYSTSNYIPSNVSFSSTDITFDNIGNTFDSDSVLYEDFGYIYDTDTLTPFGSIDIQEISNSSVLRINIGSGNIFISGRQTSPVVTRWVGTGTLFEIGSGLERTISPYLSSGTLRIGSSAAATALESITKSYNESSIYVPLHDYGNISDIANESLLDYGSISEPFLSLLSYDDYGLITEFDFSPVLPFVPGIFLSGASLDSYSAQTPEDTQLFIISGSIVEKNTESYFGAGTVDISGSLTERNTESYFGTGTVDISGSALESYSAQTPEDTQLFSISGSALESYSAQTPEDTQLFIISGSIVEKNTESYFGAGTVDISGSAVEKDTESYFGTGTVDISGSALESYSAQTPEDTQLFTISGSALESYSAQTPEDTQLFIISGSLTERNTESYFGTGTVDIVGSAIEKNTESYFGIGTVDISGSALESYSAQTPEDTQLFIISGSALESYSAQTPEDTQLFIISGSIVEKNTESYFGAGTVDISGSIVERNTESYFGTGTVDISGSALESYSAQTPEDTQLFTIYGELNHPNIDYTPHYGIEKNIGIGTTGIQLNIFSRNYSNRYPGPGGGLPDNAGIGTIVLSTNAITRAIVPYKAQGYISIGGTANEAFCITTYNGSGIYTLSGISSTKKVSVYGYYGDDNDPGTSGTIFISQQTSISIEIEVDSYNGSGGVGVSGNSSILIRNSFNGSGLIAIISTADHSYSAQTPEDTQLFSISGSALESYSAQTPEDTVLYTFSNGIITENIVKSYDAITNNITIGGQSDTSFAPSYNASGKIRLVSRSVDHDYDTCDSEEFTCDNQDSAFISFVANPPENTILFNISGSAVTSENDLHVYNGSGSEIIYGSYTDLKRSYSETGSGNIFIFNSGSDSEGKVYIGSGTLFTLFGGSQSYSAQTPENTIIINISGSAISKVEFEYSYIGIGQFNISGISSTRKINVYSDFGIGTINISGNLVHPNIQFIPSLGGVGTINVIGSSNQSISRRYYESSGSLFAISEGSQSFTYSGYIGFGTIYITSISASTIDNSFQIPRTYVSII